MAIVLSISIVGVTDARNCYVALTYAFFRHYKLSYLHEHN